jgi:hypothetical protein
VGASKRAQVNAGLSRADLTEVQVRGKPRCSFEVGLCFDAPDNRFPHFMSLLPQPGHHTTEISLFVPFVNVTS